MLLVKNVKYRKEWNKKYGEVHRKSQKKYRDKHREYYRQKTIIHDQKQQDSGYHKKKQKEYYSPLKAKARNFINNNNLRGKSCEICDSQNNLETHHPDYSKPNKFNTLCRIHHNEMHSK